MSVFLADRRSFPCMHAKACESCFIIFTACVMLRLQERVRKQDEIGVVWASGRTGWKRSVKGDEREMRVMREQADAAGVTCIICSSSFHPATAHCARSPHRSRSPTWILYTKKGKALPLRSAGLTPIPIAVNADGLHRHSSCCTTALAEQESGGLHHPSPTIP